MSEQTAHASISEALFAVQGELGVVLKKDASNPHFKSRFLSFPKLLAEVKPVLHSHGILLKQTPFSPEPNIIGVRTTMLHVASNTIDESEMSLNMGNNPQKFGSGISYLRRYALQSILGLTSGDDDDAEALTQQVSRKAGDRRTAKFNEWIRFKFKIPGLAADFGAWAKERGLSSSTMTPDDMESAAKWIKAWEMNRSADEVDSIGGGASNV